MPSVSSDTRIHRPLRRRNRSTRPTPSRRYRRTPARTARRTGTWGIALPENQAARDRDDARLETSPRSSIIASRADHCQPGRRPGFPQTSRRMDAAVERERWRALPWWFAMSSETSVRCCNARRASWGERLVDYGVGSTRRANVDARPHPCLSREAEISALRESHAEHGRPGAVDDGETRRRRRWRRCSHRRSTSLPPARSRSSPPSAAAQPGCRLRTIADVETRPSRPPNG